MKRVGLIGGVSPESTVIYYRWLNEAVARQFGAPHSFNGLFYMLDYGVMIDHYSNDDWAKFKAEIVEGATALERAGAEALVICSNTSHIGAEAAASATGLPVLHLLDALSEAMTKAEVKRPLLLGTPVVMSGAYYKTELSARYGGEIMFPDSWAQNAIGRIILNELVRGRVYDESRDELIALIDRAQSYGADSVILGCTELCMILSQADCDIPVFDTTAIHVNAIANWAFEGS